MEVSGLMINGIQVQRWMERWMSSPLQRPEKTETRTADIVTNTLATKPGRISREQSGGMRSSHSSTDVPLPDAIFASLSTPQTITWALQLTAGAAIMLTACQEMSRSGSKPASWAWRTLCWTVAFFAICGIAEAKRTCAVRWEDAPDDLLWMVPPLSQPRF